MILTLEDFATLGVMMIVVLTPVYTYIAMQET